jgi:sRNA-binding carbon storage regulator CsrA
MLAVAAIGKDVALTITGTGVFNDRTYRQKAPPVTLTVNAPEAIEVKAAEVKPEVKSVDAKLAKP